MIMLLLLHPIFSFGFPSDIEIWGLHYSGRKKGNDAINSGRSQSSMPTQSSATSLADLSDCKPTYTYSIYACMSNGPLLFNHDTFSRVTSRLIRQISTTQAAGLLVTHRQRQMQYTTYPKVTNVALQVAGAQTWNFLPLDAPLAPAATSWPNMMYDLQ